MASIKNVAVVGASGSLGGHVLTALLNSANFNITVIKRASSTATFSPSVKVLTADFSCVSSLTAALKNQDAVVCTLGKTALTAQPLLVSAAVAAGVKRFLPSDFGCDLSRPITAALPVYAAKIATHEKLREAAAANPEFSYTLVVNGAFLDFGLKTGFLLAWKEGKPKFYDGGDVRFSATTMASVGLAVVGILSQLEETRNRFVYVKDVDLTQKRLLELAKKVYPDRKWAEPMVVSTADLVKASDESLARGEVTMQIMSAYIVRANFGPPEYGGLVTKDDNELLGLKGKTDADVEGLLRSLMIV